MNRLLPVLLTAVLIVLLGITGVLLYAFSEAGNTTIKHYIQQSLEEKLQMPVDVRKFTLEAGKSRLILRLNRQADIEVVVHYSLLNQSFKGIYSVKAHDFKYKEMLLRQLQVVGDFKGKADDIVIDGKGTALDAALAYRFTLEKKVPKNIEAVMKGVAVDELLDLASLPPLLQGKMDLDIKMPDIGEEFANGYANVLVKKALFDREIVKKHYDLEIPQKSYVTLNMDVKLKGETLQMFAKAKSNLFILQADDVLINLKDKNLTAQYAMDVKEMGILSQNALAGPLKVTGTLEGGEQRYRIKGITHSLGGTLHFDIAEVSTLAFQNLDLVKIQRLGKQEILAKGNLSGNVELDKSLESGEYTLQIKEGVFVAKNIQKAFGYQLPSANHFTLNTKGKIVKNILNAEAELKSNLSDIKLSDVYYDIKKKRAKTNYDVFLPNIGLLIPDNKAVKRGYIRLKGDAQFDKILKAKGSVKGLGEKLTFIYDGKGVKLDAKNLFIEKLLSLSNLPRYVKGKLSAEVMLSDIEAKEGTFSFKAAHLQTQPSVMERLIGKKLMIDLALTSKGKLQSGVGYLNTKIKTSMGDVYLDDTRYDVNSEALKSKYRLNIPQLEKTYALTGNKLYGPMELRGDIIKQKELKVVGNTVSLGGRVDYTLIGDKFNSEITKVPLENILGVFGHDKLVQGDTYGTVTYDIKKRTGVVAIDIKAFKIKPSSTTNTIKMFIGKDPARIIYKTTTLKAKLQGDITYYTLRAKGSRSSIEILNGKIDKKANMHRANFKFVYEKYVVTGTIGGTVDNPRIMVDPSSVMQSKTGEKIQEKLDKTLGKDMGKAVGGFLKGLKF